ncbi:hydroxymethylglutaryl-CoA reductase (NADPH) [Caldicoprobacter guelmensis]|uniref:hypothetical protein n=1 Tax=Caldicoprobacter guelmensis TaxID=1170224 RepID=UPI00195D4927|nr:hypothetical protein [Caldicoprobacter guelmensis]MBM7583426.1 hydroxymethylglutaryl-CoA reductase (NADPH) [Caldicoprobacter guelmensis]
MNNEKLEKIKEQLKSGKIKQQDLEMIIFKEVYNSEACKVKDACRDAEVIRCEVIEERTGVSLETIKKAHIDTCNIVSGKYILPGIELKVGGAIIPMGIAGPIRIKGKYVNDEEVYIPLATNEAALLAGVQRGIKAINLAGGINTLVHFDGMARAPLIEAPDIYQAQWLCREVKENKELLMELGKYVKDPFVRLEYIEPYQLGTKVFLRMFFKTGDAMGMNGVTKASADITKALLERLKGWRLITISSNLCTDKKSAHINVLTGRGKSVQTEVFIPKNVLESVFKKGVTAKKVEQVVFHKCYLGAALSGTISGFNVNAANVVAAFFAATGQDLAQVITSASCFVQAEATDDGSLHFMVSLPCIELAAFGGGTQFGTAREALNLIGCGKRGNSIDENTSVMRLAEIAAAAVTALELNTSCAQAAEYEMAESHVRLARGEFE